MRLDELPVRRTFVSEAIDFVVSGEINFVIVEAGVTPTMTARQIADRRWGMEEPGDERSRPPSPTKDE